ncbi:MAG: ribonuclease P protein component [Syntrophales bacterium]|nr:ribonuclease P protein component [Syntrophales bacterium]MCK9528379.1 ribonuclease P protein component [Syntrophales bacterium]MDX9922696.1 ribonuclease P protein component [Syntrophales bacterium]
MGTFSIRRNEKIRTRSDFQAVYKKGKRIHSKSFIVLLSRNDKGTARFGITVGKKVGNAVRRNRIKRLVREFFRLNRDRFPESTDVVVIARKDLSLTGYREVASELGRIFKQR